MHCSRCQINALKDQLLAQYPDGVPPPAKAQPLYARCIICSHGCTDAKGRSRCDTFTQKSHLEKRIPDLSRAVERLARDAARNHDLYAFALARKRDELAAARRAFSACRDACLHCDRSADDNPSNAGICFVSRDASRSSSDPRDDNPSIADWITSRAIAANPTVTPGGPVPSAYAAPSKATVSNLPPDAEDALRKELANFASRTSIVDKILAAVLLTRNPRGRTNECYNLTDFAKLRWIFDVDRAGNRHETEVSRFLRAAGWIPKSDLPGAAKARIGISKQAVSVRFKNLVRKVPFLAALTARSVSQDDATESPASPASHASSNNSQTARTARRRAPVAPQSASSSRLFQPDLIDTASLLQVPERASRH